MIKSGLKGENLLNCYIVVGLPGSGLAARVASAYPGRYHVIAPDSAWVVAGPEITPINVCEKLGIVDTSSGMVNSVGHGVVVKLDNYYGVLDPALWQRMNSWLATP